MNIAHLVLGSSSVYHRSTGKVPGTHHMKGKGEPHGFKAGRKEGTGNGIEFRDR
jgi:hypothetical protein